MRNPTIFRGGPLSLAMTKTPISPPPESADGTAKREHQTTVKIEPKSVGFRFPRRLRHDSLAQSTITRRLLSLSRASRAETQRIIRGIRD